jgi:hypothetical protein
VVPMWVGMGAELEAGVGAEVGVSASGSQIGDVGRSGLSQPDIAPPTRAGCGQPLVASFGPNPLRFHQTIGGSWRFLTPTAGRGYLLLRRQSLALS